MKRLGLAVAWLLLAVAPARAKTGATTIGLFVPSTIPDGQARFDLGQKLAAELQKALGHPVEALSFARYSDFAAAARAGKLDLGVVDGWVAAEASERFTPVAVAVIAGETRQRWALVSRGARTLAELAGKRVALTRGVGPGDGLFVTNVIFEGDLDAPARFKLTFVPAVESATKMLDIGSADAALVPLAQAGGKGRVVYKSPQVLTAVAVAFRGGGRDLGAALRSVGAVAPLDRFVTEGVDELVALRRVLLRGPTPPPPALADSPPPRPDLRALVTFKGVSPTWPSFIETLNVPSEAPED